MELVVKKQALPEIDFNYDEIKKEVQQELKKYQGLIFDDESQIGEAKKVRANLNKVAKTFDNERKRLKKELSQPIKDFEEKVKTIVGMIDNANEGIDIQVKAFEEKKREEKNNEIEELFKSLDIEEFKLEDIFNDKWLNATYSLNKIEEEMVEFKNKVFRELQTLRSLIENNTDYVLAKSDYLKSFDINEVLQDYKEKQQEIKKVKEEESKEIEEEKKNEGVYTLTFEVKATKTQIRKLKDFLVDNKIEHKRKEDK